MRSQALRSAVRRLRQVATPVPPAGPDAELLRAFAGRRDGGAFEQIVRRHGPMVLGVCRRVLRDPADADDAFQATFLVLVRKAGSLRAPDRLAGWLHQVAHRVAKKARAIRLNRARRQGGLFDVPSGEAPAEVVWRELRPIFDAELDRLPDRLRLPAVLCLLEGYSKAEAARALGWPEGTVSCRLQRARERLRARLAARGLTLSAGALAVALFEGASSATVPDRLIASTLQGVLNPAAAAGARALADGVTQAMFLAKVKAAAAAVLVVGVVGTGTGVALVPGGGLSQVVAGEPGNGSQPKSPPASVPGETKSEPLSRAELDVKLKAQRAKAENLWPLVQKGTYPQSDLNEVLSAIARTEAQLKRSSADPADIDRAIQKQELELLKERLDFEEKMVRKGFMTEAQVKKTRLEVAKAEAALAKTEAPKAPDPRRAAAEETIRKLEQIVEQTRQGVRRGTIPEAELLNSEATLARYKFEMLFPDDRRPAAPVPPTAEQRAALEAVVKKLEEIAAQAENGVKRGVMPESELLNAQLKVLEYKFKLAELGAAPADPKAVPDFAAVIAARERDLARAEAMQKRGAIAEDEVRGLRIDLARLRAETAAARGDFAEEAKQREAVVAEVEGRAAAVRRRAERVDLTQADLRAVNVAVAEARVDALKANVRRQLADIVRAKEEGLRDVRKLFDAKAIPASEVQTAELDLARAKARLAAER